MTKRETNSNGSWANHARHVRLTDAGYEAAVSRATFARARAALDIAEKYHASVQLLAELDSENGEETSVARSRRDLAYSAADAMALVCPFDSFKNHTVGEHGLTQLVREIAESFWGQIEDHTPEEDEGSEGEGAADGAEVMMAPLSVPAVRVDHATKIRARAVRRLCEDPSTDAPTEAARRRLQHMAETAGMDLKNFLTACELPSLPALNQKS